MACKPVSLDHVDIFVRNRALSTDKRCFPGSLAAGCEWATCGFPCGPGG